MYEAEIAVGGFIVAGCQSTGVFQFVEAAFDHVPQGVDCDIDGQLDQPIPLGGYHRDTAAFVHILTNEVGIVALVD